MQLLPRATYLRLSNVYWLLSNAHALEADFMRFYGIYDPWSLDDSAKFVTLAMGCLYYEGALAAIAQDERDKRSQRNTGGSQSPTARQVYYSPHADPDADTATIELTEESYLHARLKEAR